MMNPSLRKRLIAAFIAMGLSAPSTYVAINLTEPSEGTILKPYSDPIGLTTYCTGHLAKKGEKIKSSYTEQECMDLFAEDFKKHQDELNRLVKVPYASEWEKAAITDFTFNVGIGNVQSSTLLKLINQGKHEEACHQLLRWVKAGGKTLKGLVERRKKTLPYCLGKLPYDKEQDYQHFLNEYKNEINDKTKAGR